jgi:hypothetical protein
MLAVLATLATIAVLLGLTAIGTVIGSTRLSRRPKDLT